MSLNIDLDSGLRPEQVVKSANAFGYNEFPTSPPQYFLLMLLDSLKDRVLIVLIIAAIVSLIVGMVEDPEHGYIEGVAILFAITLVALITTGNNYSKELQFRALERSSQQDEKTTVIRGGQVQLIKTSALVVGDVVKLQVGDMVPADCILIDSRVTAKSNQSALTGEPEDVRKSKEEDPFLLSSCLISECDGDLRAFVTGIGLHSQWGKIKSSLVVESVNTPLQDKLEAMTAKVCRYDTHYCYTHLAY